MVLDSFYPSMLQMQHSEDALNKHYHKIPVTVSYRIVLSYDLTVHCGSWVRLRGNNFGFQRFSFFLRFRNTHPKNL